jgi:glucan phosphoethanolaminetransferase (alkaline phosphatase superfamily)
LEVVAVVPLLRILLISLVVDAGEVGLEGVHPMVLLVVVVVTGNAVL